MIQSQGFVQRGSSMPLHVQNVTNPPITKRDLMKIHEYQGKEILRQFGVPVPRGIPAFTV
ncbi:MAG: succinyl-CoA synthetase subunit beta, partial [Pseudomonadota bacterium]